jgi:hypothetical protein
MAGEFNIFHTKAVDDGDGMYARVWRNAPESRQAEREKKATPSIKYFYYPLEQGGRARVCGLRTPFYPSFISAILAGPAPE